MENGSAALFVMSGMIAHSVTDGAHGQLEYMHGAQAAVSAADTTAYIVQSYDTLPGAAKDAWDGYSADIDEATAEGDTLKAEKLRSKRYMVVGSMIWQPGPITGKLFQNRTSNGDPVVLDLFGGARSQNPGAINVDLIAQDGVQASALKLPFKNSSVDEVIASNPFIPGGQAAIDFLPEAARVAKPGAEIILNFTKKNPFGSKLPDANTLRQLNLEIIQEAGPLLPRFKDQIFRRTDGSIIPNDNILTTILKKTE